MISRLKTTGTLPESGRAGLTSWSAYVDDEPGKTVSWHFTSSYSASYSASNGPNSFLPIDNLENFVLLLTSSFTAQALSTIFAGPTTIDLSSSLTQSARMYGFKEGGELNNFVWLDYFITGNNLPNVSQGQSRETYYLRTPHQLVRNSSFSLFNSFSPFYTRKLPRKQSSW